MILKNRGPMKASDMAAELVRQMDVLRQHEQNIAELERAVAERERQYGTPSSQIHAAIEAGTLRETADVCNWIIDYELLERSRASQRGSARME